MTGSDSRRQSIRVLHTAETIKGGIATYLNELLVHQIELFGSDNVRVLVPASHAGELPNVDSACIVTFPDAGGRVQNALRVAARAIKLAKHFQPEVVHVHSTFAGIAVRLRLALSLSRAKVVYCPHGWAFDREAPWAVNATVRVLERMLAPITDAIVAISGHELKSGLAIGIPARKLQLVYNAIAMTPPEPSIPLPAWPEGRKRLLFVGRFDRQKGVDVFLEAVNQLQDDVFAYVIGGSVLGDESSLAIPANVCLTGWLGRTEIEAYFRSADVIVIPSRWEGFGLISLEAMRAGKAVIASRVGGLPEIIDDGVTGVLLAPDDAAAIVRTVTSLDRAALAKMGQNGYLRFSKKFTSDVLVRTMSELYCRLLSISAVDRESTQS